MYDGDWKDGGSLMPRHRDARTSAFHWPPRLVRAGLLAKGRAGKWWPIDAASAEVSWHPPEADG